MAAGGRATPDSARGRDAGLRRRFQILRSLLRHNSRALQHLADLQTDLDLVESHDPRLAVRLRRLLAEVWLMAEELELLAGKRHRALYDALRIIGLELDARCRDDARTDREALALLLDDECVEDQRLIGGKAAGLARLRRRVPDLVPPAFVVTTAAYRLFLEANDLLDPIATLLADIHAAADRDLVRARSATLRDLIERAEIPPAVTARIQELAASVGAPEQAWAVRSSACSEDSRWSFAGQFDSVLDVAADDLAGAYRAVLAGRFSERAILYRLHGGFREVDTPMAVLFMPMVEARAAGVLYTADPQHPSDDRMVVTMVPGLSDRLLRGQVQGDTVTLTRASQPRVEAGTSGGGAVPDYMSRELVETLGKVGRDLAEFMGHELDVEWAVEGEGRLVLLQQRPLRVPTPEEERRARRNTPPLIDGGTTVVPGRAEGPVEHLPSSGPLRLACRAPVAVLDLATPEIAAVLPSVAALLVRRGNPAGHAATLIREAGVPTLFGVGDAVSSLSPRVAVSVDSSRHRVYRGSRWPGVRERILARTRSGRVRRTPGPLHDLVTELHLKDPGAREFRADACRSVHDVIRFAHEMSIRSLFDFGDRQHRFWARTTSRLRSPLPLDLRFIDMGAPAGRARTTRPDEVDSVPFQAFWRGLAGGEVSWNRRWVGEQDWMPREFVDAIRRGPGSYRQKGSPSYVVVAPDYLNFNALVTYHYAMIDAVVGPGKDRNHVHFRCRGGGADPRGMARRARFLAAVLRHSWFVVDRSGDLVTGWLRGYPRRDSEEALTMLGRLIACSRQMDSFLVHDGSVDEWVDRFLAGDFAAFDALG